MLCIDIAPPWSRPLGVIFRKNYLKFNRHLFFFKFSQNWLTYSTVPPLPPQYMVLLLLDHKRAGERHSLKDLPRNS